jgi:hypothetical protein
LQQLGDIEAKLAGLHEGWWCRVTCDAEAVKRAARLRKRSARATICKQYVGAYAGR